MKRRKKHFWYDWKIYHKYLNWRFKQKVRSGEVLNSLLWLTERHVEYENKLLGSMPRLLDNKLLGCQPMSTPTSPIFFLKWVKDEKEFKEWEGI